MTKVSELVAPELDYWVSRCEGMHYGGSPFSVRDGFVFVGIMDTPFTPSTGWRFGGPIIEEQRIAVVPAAPGLWGSFRQEPGADGGRHWSGPTPLIAAMRAYVASKFGDTVEAA